MDIATILLIAVALAVDAFAVAVAAGICLPRVGARRTFRLSWHFGLFQAGMNVIGWAVGVSVRSGIERFDHWLAFGLLCVVGGRMIQEALTGDEEERCERDPTRGGSLVLLSVATSLDSLAVGLSFAVLGVPVWRPALIIGLVAAILTAAGLHLGRLAGRASSLGRNAEIIGGVVLIAIGVKILYEHGVF